MGRKNLDGGKVVSIAFKHVIASALLVLTLQGCGGGVETLSLNRELTVLHGQKVAAMQAKSLGTVSGDKLVIAAGGDFDDELEKLGDQAVKAVSDRKEVADKISLYRIGSTAYWISGSPRVLDAAREGERLCEPKPDVAPRDCGMLMLVSLFAANDDGVTKFDKMRDDFEEIRLSQKNVGAELEKRFAEAVKNYQSIETTFTALMARRSKIPTDAPTEFKLAVDNRVSTVSNNVRNTLSHVVSAVNGNADKISRCEQLLADYMTKVVAPAAKEFGRTLQPIRCRPVA